MAVVPDFPRPPFNVAAMEEAQALTARALELHRLADDEQDPDRRADQRRRACWLDIAADRIVPVEYRQ